MPSSAKRALVIILVIVGCVVTQYARYLLADRAHNSGMTVVSKEATGMSIMHGLGDGDRRGTLRVGRKPIFTLSDLGSAQTIFILSPKLEPSTREARLLGAAVRKGGRLVVSFHDQTTWNRIQGLLHAVEVNVKLKDFADFSNGKSSVVVANEETGIFLAGHSYEFYSPRIFDDATCIRGSELSCYVQLRRFGRGEVMVVAGVPPWSNALIGRAANSQLAFQILDQWQPVLFEEYHQFFTEKGWKDLLQDPGLALPLVGILVTVLLYFIFGYTEFHDRTLVPEAPKEVAGYHDLNRSIVEATFLRSSDAEIVQRHVAFLERMFPMEKSMIARAIQSSDTGRRSLEASGAALIALHRRLLHERGAGNI